MTTWVTGFLDVPEGRWALAREFWAAATGWRESPAHGERGQFHTLVPPAGDSWLRLQRVTDGPARMHLDLDSPDRATAVAVSRGAGATPAWTHGDVEVVRSPGGFVLCHTVGAPAARYAPGRASSTRSASTSLPPTGTPRPRSGPR